jgi:hypothetical protein
MDLNSEINRSSLISAFKELSSDKNFKILSEETPVYNCIAWAMGYTDRWVEPNDDFPGVWWPFGAEHGMSPGDLITAFEAEGFVQTDDILFEPDCDKVVLYHSHGEWTHAARIVSENVEHSKFGMSWDGTHSHNVFAKTPYGTPFAYMKRAKAHCKTTITPGTIEVDTALLHKLLHK